MCSVSMHPSRSSAVFQQCSLNKGLNFHMCLSNGVKAKAPLYAFTQAAHYRSKKVETGNLNSWFGFCGVLTDKLLLHQEIILFIRVTGLHSLSVHATVHAHVEAVCLQGEKASLGDLRTVYFQLCCCHAMLLRKHLLSFSDSVSLKITMLRSFFHCRDFIVMPWKSYFRIAIIYNIQTDRKLE